LISSKIRFYPYSIKIGNYPLAQQLLQRWIYEDKTDIDVATILVKAGVAKNDIVLGYLSPTLREFSEYAVAQAIIDL